MFNSGNLKNNGANQDDIQKRNTENFVGHNMSLSSNNANSPQSESASKTSTTAALRRWRRPEAQDNSSKNVSTRSTSNNTENGVKNPSSTVNQSKEMNSLNNNNHNNNNSYTNNTHIDLNGGSASQNDYSMFVSPASLSPIVPQSTARPYDTNAYIPRVPPETGAYSRTSPVVTTPNKLTPDVKSSDTTVRHPISGNIQSPYYQHDTAAQQHYRNTTGYPIQNTPPLTPTSTQSPIYGVPNQKRDYGYQNYTAKSPQEQRITREHSVLTHSYSTGSGQGIGDDSSKMNGYRQQDSRVFPQAYLQNTAERRVTPPKPKSPTYRTFPNSPAMMDSRILAQNYVTTSGRVQTAEYMAQNYYLNKSSCIVQEARVQNQLHSTENPILDRGYQQSYNSYIMPKSTVINSQDPKLYRNIIATSKKHSAPFPILEQRLNTAESYSPEYLAQNNSQSKYGQVIMPRSSPTSRITRDSSNIQMQTNFTPQASNQKCPQDMMVPSNYTLHNKYFQQNPNQDWRLIKDYEPNTHLNQMNQMHSRLPHSSANRTPEVPRDIPFMEQNQRIIQKPRMFYPEPGSVEYLQYAGKTNIPVAQKSPKVISYNVADQRIPEQIQNDYLNLPRNSSNPLRPNEYPRNPVIQAPNAPEGSYIVHQAFRSEVPPNDQQNYQMIQNSRHPSYAINYSNRQVKEIPPRNISPRRTFQENMPYFVISPPHAGLSNNSPPLYNAEHSQQNYPGYYARGPNYPGVGAKPSIPHYSVDSTKYQNVPFSRNMSQQRHPYGYQDQYFQRTMDPNQFAGNMYRQHNLALSEQAAQARSYAEEYRNEGSINSNYNEFERNRRKEEIGKSLKEFLESWEDDEDIVSNLPDLVLNIPTDRQKNNSVSSLESGENSEVGQTIPPNEIHKDNQGNPQAEPLYVLDARSISSDALSQYLPYCKVYQSLPENIRGFYPNSVPSEDASVASQQVASETSETQPESEDLESNIIDSPSPHDLSVNRKTDKEDNVQAEVLNLSTNRNKENNEFMTEEYSNASDDVSVSENIPSPSISNTIKSKEDAKKENEIIKSPIEVVQDKNKENDTKETQLKPSVENEAKQDSINEKPVTASVIVQNTFMPNKSDICEKSKDNQIEKLNLENSSEHINNEISNDGTENISSPKSKNLENKRPSVDSMESADSIRTSLIESEIKDIDFNKDSLDHDQFDFDTALLSTETKDSNEDSKTDEDVNKNSLIRDNGIDISLDTMLLSPEPIHTTFEDCIPEISNSPKTDDTSVSIENRDDEKTENVEKVIEELNLSKSNPETSNTDSFEKPVDSSEILENADTEIIEQCNCIEELNNSEKHKENIFVNTEEQSDLEIEKYNNDKDSIETEQTKHETTEVDKNKESENEDVKLNTIDDESEKVDDTKIEITEKEIDLSTMEVEDSICEPHINNNRSSFLMEEILKETVKPKKQSVENFNIKAVNIDEDDLKLSETVEQVTPVNEDNINETDNHTDDSKDNSDNKENTENSINVFSEENDEANISISEDSNINEISNQSIILEDIELVEDTEKNQTLIETTLENDKQSTIECTEINEEILIEASKNEEILKNKNSVSTNIVEAEIINNDQELSKLKTIVESTNITSNEIKVTETLDVTENDLSHEDTNEKLEKTDKIHDLYVENIISEKEQQEPFINSTPVLMQEEITLDVTKNDLSHEDINEKIEKTDKIHNLNVENITEKEQLEPFINSPPVSMQEEITLNEEITDENTKESQINEIEVITENNSNTELTSTTEENENCSDKSPKIKDETSIFDEDTLCGFEDLEEDKNIKVSDELITDDPKEVIEESKNTLNSFTTELPSEEPNNCLKKELNDDLPTTTDHVSSDTDEYQHLIKLEDEETLDNTFVQKDDEEKVEIKVDATKIENDICQDSKETCHFKISDSCEKEIETSVLSPKNLEESIVKDKIIEEILETKEETATDVLEDDTETKVNEIFEEEILVEHILTDENITFMENEIVEKVEENIIVSEEPSSCVVVYSDDENIVILQSDSDELVNPEIVESTYITTEEVNGEETMKQEMVIVDMNKEELIPEKVIEEEVIGNEVIICENGIEDDWIQNEEIVESKIEEQDKKENEKPKIEDIEKKRSLMEKRREKKKRLEKLRKRKLLATIKATNKFLEEERKAYTISETAINEHINSGSPFKEKITDDKELFINPENPSSSSEDNSSMTHELLNLKPRIKRRFSYVDSSSPKIDFVAPKRRYSNTEYLRNNFKKPIINLDEISNNITKVIENLNKQENLQYNQSLENLKPANKINNKIQDLPKVIDHSKPVVNESNNICPLLSKENCFGRFKVRKVVDVDELFVKPPECPIKPIIKPVINVEEKNVQVKQVESTNEIKQPNIIEETIKNDSTILKEPKLTDIDKNISKELETNSQQSINPTSNTKFEKLPSFQNYTEDLRKKIKTDVIKDEPIKLLQTPKVVIKPLPVTKVPEIGNISTPLQSTLSLPNKQRNIDPRIERPKEIPKPEVPSVLIKNKGTPFGLTEYTKYYLKMKTGQTIDPQIHFGQNGIKRLDPRLTAKPAKTTENVEKPIVPLKQKTDINTKLVINQEKKVKINLQDYRNRKLSESEKQPSNPKEQLEETTDPINGLSNTEPCRFYIRDKSKKLQNNNKAVEKIVIKPKKTLDKVSNQQFGISKDNSNSLDCNNLSNDTLKSNLDFKTQKPKKKRKRFRNLDASDEEDEVVNKQQNVTKENENIIDASIKLNEDCQQSPTISQHSGSGDSICSCCVDLNSNGGTTKNNCGLKCHIKLNSLDSKIRNYEINKNSSGISNLKLTLKPVQKKPKPAFAEVLSSIDSVVENEVKTTKRKPCKVGLNKCDNSGGGGGKKSTMWTIKNKVPKVIIKRNASGYCAVFRDVSSNPIWQPKIRLKRQKYIESLVLSNQVKLSKKIPS